MNIKLNQKIIKEMCGIVSFKRGEAFYRTNKILFEEYNATGCKALVEGMEDFHVSIDMDVNGGILTACSCPTLTSFQKDCQHIAAVLLSIYEHQRQGSTPVGTKDLQSTFTTNQTETTGIMTLFNGRVKQTSSHQPHFEKRKVLDLEITCMPIHVSQNKYLIGIKVKVGEVNVDNIRSFLTQVKNGNSSRLSSTFNYDPSLHCFQLESDAVLQQLIQVFNDEKMYGESLPVKSAYANSNDILLIPPSSWERLLPLLTKAPLIKLVYDGNMIEGIHLSKEQLPLQFKFEETEGKGYQLNVEGLNHIIILDSYSAVLSGREYIQMNEEDLQRLSDLKGMIDASGANHFLIPTKQIDYFLEKVVPGLRKLGNVQLSEAVTRQFAKIPLIAKLYLDRVKNRLLAGLEFHYENMVINPLENKQLGSKLIRDEEKENEILQLMEESSFSKTDGGYFFHNEELEYEFLYHVVPKLSKLVQIYATTAVKDRIVVGNARPRIRIKVKKERTNWLEFKFEMDGIPEKHIRDILLALEEKRKYYRLPNGTLLSLETKEFEDINKFQQALPVQQEDWENGLDVPIVRGFQLLDSVEDRNTFTFEESFREFLDNISNPEKVEVEVPKGLVSTLRDYQILGYKWMKTLANYGFGGILADDMGLGKTLQSITFIVSEISAIRKQKKPILIVCPSSLTYNWLSEIMKFAPELETVIIDGKKNERTKLQKDLMDMDVVITSYPLLRKDLKWYEKQAFHTVFFDEAQAFKNPVTQTARAVQRIQADNRFALTGTPVENSLEELWSIFRIVFPELFQGLKEYSNLSRKTIARRIRPFLLRRLKEDVLEELPEKMESIESAELLPDQKKLYTAYLAKLRHDTLKHLDKDTLRKNKIRILAGLTRLRQICCHPALFVDGYQGSSAKFEQLLQLIEESKLSGRRVLIFSQFTKMLHLIGQELADQGLPFFYLDGKTPSEERVEFCNRFNEGERDFFLISLKAGGTGLNLTGADTVILYDLWWNPAVEEQAADRAHRMGQKNVVQVIKLVARGTIEDKMNELQEKKRHLIEEIIDPENKGTATLTEEDIREILMI